MSELKDRFKEMAAYYGLSVRKLEEKCGLKRGNLSNTTGTINSDNLTKIFDTCPEISLPWLVTGFGDMLKIEKQFTKTSKIKQSLTDNILIPLVKENAVAGFWNNAGMIKQYDVIAYYLIPKFRNTYIDFLIEIFGISMMPKFKGGDIIACSIIRESKFIQWNKCYVIATTEQGILVKRILKSDREECITAVSDNSDYPPFDIPWNEVVGIALVVGLIRLE